MSRPLCKGFLLNRPNGHEILFAELPDGRVVRNGPRPYSTTFDAKGRRWETVDYVPDAAEFIGNYRIPAVIATP